MSQCPACKAEVSAWSVEEVRTQWLEPPHVRTSIVRRYACLQCGWGLMPGADPAGVALEATPEAEAVSPDPNRPPTPPPPPRTRDT